MAYSDQTKWNQRYQNNPIPNQPIEILKKALPLIEGKKALDIACGMGRHSIYLAKKGFIVDALDISSVAIAQLKGEQNIFPICIDFDKERLPQKKYHLIVCSYFLKRSLFPQIIQRLENRGILIYETFISHPQNEQTPSNSSFLLKENELFEVFSPTLEILFYKEYWDKTMKGNRMYKASLIAQKKH